MKIAVRYYTRSGNTKKLAQAVAAAVDAQALEVSVPLTEDTDMVFLGCSYYGFDVDDAVKQFIRENRAHIGRLVCFGTSAMMKSVKKPVTRVAAAVGVPVAEEEFHCRGAFGPAHKGRPNREDLKSAAQFAKKIIE